MFSQTPERTMRVVRVVLAVGWLGLIASFFYDPFTPRLTSPDNHASPFRINRTADLPDPTARYDCPRYFPYEPGTPVGSRTIDWVGRAANTCDDRCPRIQNRCLINAPYPMGVRIWWTIIFPWVPAALLVLGHETWRRICPLGFFSQLPRWFGIQRKQKKVNPETGIVERKLVLLGPDSWLARNHWNVQFGLLWFGLSMRLLVVNSDRAALGLFLLGWVLFSMVIGFLYGGKTWCNYLCPISPVQKFYTEPRGLLEGRAHISLRVITGSMCRTTDSAGNEQSACVGCRSPCPDIDLERQYWTDLQRNDRRFFYYGYPGLVLGFYTYYKLYSGTWSYYFSGFWTHEEELSASLWSPGLYLFDTVIPIPKLVAAPGTLALFILGSYGVGVALERSYLAARTRLQKPLTPELLQHHVYALCTAATFVCFYLFAGRPNINLLPPAMRTFIDMLIAFLAATWLGVAWRRTPQLYERESLGSSLRKQLKKLSLDLSKVLGGRTLDELPPEEVYVIAKALPELTSQQKRETYKETIREALRNGHAQTTAGLKVLEEMRDRMGISETEHGQILTELGVEDHQLLDPTARQNQEEWLRMESYRKGLETLLLELVERGVPVQDALKKDSVAIEVRRLQTLYNITPSEQEKALSTLFSSRSGVMREAGILVGRIAQLAQRSEGLALLEFGPASAYARMLRKLFELERLQSVRRLMNIFSIAGATPESLDVAEQLARIAQRDVHAVLEELDDNGVPVWPSRLTTVMKATLERRTSTSDPAPRTLPFAAATEILREVVREQEPIARSVAIRCLSVLDQKAGAAEAERLFDATMLPHWLLMETADEVLAETPTRSGIVDRLVLLSDTDLFRPLAPEALAALAKDSTVRKYGAGEALCRQGAPSDELLVLVRGRACVCIERDGVTTEVSRIESGQAIGELGVLTRTARSATVIATEEGAEVVAIPGARLSALLEQDGRVASALLRTVSKRLTTTLAKLDHRPTLTPSA